MHFVGVDFDVDWSLSPLAQPARTLTPAYRAPVAGRPTAGGVAARTSPVAGRWTPPSVDTYSTEMTASVDPGPPRPAPVSASLSPAPARDSPRPLVFDIEVGRRLPDDDDVARPVQRLTAMPRPDTPSNVWSVEALSQIAVVDRSHLVIRRFLYVRTIRFAFFNAGRDQFDRSDCSDQNVRRNCTACHAHLFTVREFHSGLYVRSEIKNA